MRDATVLARMERAVARFEAIVETLDRLVSEWDDDPEGGIVDVKAVERGHAYMDRRNLENGADK